MLASEPPAVFTAYTSNITNPGPTTPGTLVTAGGSANTKNTTYAQLIASTSFDAYFVQVNISNNNATNNANQGMLVDIAIGAASSETVIIPNLNASGAGNRTISTGLSAQGGQKYNFPLYIPSGSRISATAAGATASDTCYVIIRLWGDPTRPVWAGHQVTDYGTVSASSRGTLVAAGLSAAEGSWTEIVASTGTHCYYLAAGTGYGADASNQASSNFLDVGVGAATETELQALSNMPFYGDSSERHGGDPMGAYVDIPSGTRLVARCSSQQASAQSYDVILYGVS